MAGNLVRLRRGAAVCLAATVLGGGCGRDEARARKYVPPSATARAALESVLEDWQGGRAPGRIDRLNVGVEVVDRQRKEGQALADFEILGEVPGEGVRCFAVRLKFLHPDAELKSRFVVVGIDPLWVFRQEDYDLLTQWDHAMPAEQPSEQPPVSQTESNGNQSPEDSGLTTP
jgi:hypothetical protein